MNFKIIVHAVQTYCVLYHMAYQYSMVHTTLYGSWYHKFGLIVNHELDASQLRVGPFYYFVLVAVLIWSQGSPVGRISVFNLEAVKSNPSLSSFDKIASSKLFKSKLLDLKYKRSRARIQSGT